MVGQPRGLAEIQEKAALYSALPRDSEGAVNLRAAFVFDSSLPWRLVESHSANGHSTPARKEMMCFETADQCLFFIQERIDWLRADAYFVQKHMTTPTGFDVTSDWVARWQFGELFDEPRELLRRAICKTQPANVVNLLRLQGERIELPI
jgi:hypothetical protein